MLRERNMSADVHNSMEEMDEEVSAYVLITCGKASSDGNMQVEMRYEGDRALISYLLTSAQNALEL